MTIFDSHLAPIDQSKIEGLSVTQYVVQNIASFGDRESLIDAFSGKSLKFNEFSSVVRKVAVGFQKHGVKFDDVVFVALPNCIEYAVIFHALGTIGSLSFYFPFAINI